MCGALFYNWALAVKFCVLSGQYRLTRLNMTGQSGSRMAKSNKVYIKFNFVGKVGGADAKMAHGLCFMGD